MATAAAPNWGSSSFYSSGFGINEGHYALAFHTQMHQIQDKAGNKIGDPALAVMVTAYPIDREGHFVEGSEPVEEALSMGLKAHLAFVPSPDGKSIVPVPGGSGNIGGRTNWHFFLKSLEDCNGGKQAFKSSLAEIDGVHVYLQRVAEPEDRKKLRAQGKTGAAAMTAGGEEDDKKRDRTMPIITEILKSRGLPEEAAASKPSKKTTTAGKTAPKAPAASDPDEVDLEKIALDAATDVLQANDTGIGQLKFQMAVFTAVKKAHGDAVASSVKETFFSDEDALNMLVNQLDFNCENKQISPVS